MEAFQSKAGERAMTGAGCSFVEGKPVFYTAPMTCPHCKGDEVTILVDTPERRVNNCVDCGFTGVITKGDGLWWYHDWQMPEDMNDAWRDRVFAIND